MEEHIDIRALKAGDEREFRNIVEMFQDRVFNTCLGFTGNREEAEDAAQETFINVFSSVNGFREESKFSTWIYRIAVTSSLQLIRRRKMKKRFSMFFPTTAEHDSHIANAPSDAGDEPGALLENKERSEILFKAMSTLPESQRVAFTLHKIEGLSHTEIGEVMDLSQSSVESLIHRAKANLQRSLGAYYRAQQ